MQKTKKEKPKVIFTCFAGRRKSMELLIAYTDRLHSMGLIDEMHIWDFSKDSTDEIWLSDTFDQANQQKHKISRQHPYAKIFKVENKKSWKEYYRHYTTQAYPDNIIIKCDDDIVFIDAESFERFIRLRCEDQKSLLLFPSIVNNGLCAGYQFERGYMKEELGAFPKNVATGKLWANGKLCASLHKNFVDEYERWLGMARKSDEVIEIPLGQRISINFFAILSKNLFAFQMIKSRLNDEGELTMNITKKLGRPNSISMNMTVSHLSFYQQRKTGLNDVEVLEMYQNLCKSNCLKKTF